MPYWRVVMHDGDSGRPVLFPARTYETYETLAVIIKQLYLFGLLNRYVLYARGDETRTVASLREPTASYAMPAALCN
jgi:hypothetical protein